MTELAVIGMLNTLCFWKKLTYMWVPVAMMNIIFGLIYATSGNTTPIYNSTLFWEGLVIVILGLCMFLYEFLWLEVLNRKYKRKV